MRKIDDLNSKRLQFGDKNLEQFVPHIYYEVNKLIN